MRNFKMLLAYDGTRYQGWQRLSGNDNTIQGKLETVLSRILEQEVTVSGSGRTDAGTHARGQVVSFHADTAMTPAALLRQLRTFLPEDIGVLRLEEAAPRFHARLNASTKTYQYRLWNDDAPCVFERRYVWPCTQRLDVAAMQTAAELFLGEHDFLGFCANKHSKKSTVRRIDAFTVEQVGPEIRFTVTGDGFLHHMVRIMVGTLVEIGAGQRQMASIPAVLESGCRAEAGQTVPAKGLCLMEVRYH